MRLLLTHGFFLQEDPKELQIMRPYPPLGLLYLSAYLRLRGFEVDIYDSTFGSREELFRLIEGETPGMLGIYGNLLTRRNVLDIAARGQACGWRVVVGGPEPSNYAEEYLLAGADYVVQGEGEIVLEQLLRGCSAPEGVTFRDAAGKVVRTPPAAQIRDLDTLPWPDRERIDINKYLSVWRERHGTSAVSLITARGCPYHCRWCSHSTFGKTHRRRSPASVAAEVEWIVGRYGPDVLWYADDVFTIHHAWILEFARRMKERGLRVPFECISRADRITPRIAQALAELGCFRLWIGSESGSQRVLDAMERGVTVAQVRDAVHLIRAQGIQTGMFLMWGYEGEELEDIEATVDHVRACAPDVFLTTVSYPVRGTPYYADVDSRLVRLGEWRQTTDRDYRIRGRRSRRYYQFADDLLRAGTAKTVDEEQMAAARAGLQASACEVEA